MEEPHAPRVARVVSLAGSGTRRTHHARSCDDVIDDTRDGASLAVSATVASDACQGRLDVVTEPRYTPFYCEENVWWLAQDPRVADRVREVVFVTNAQRSVAVFAQRAGRGPRAGIVWDYHVVLVVRGAGEAEVWDLDCVHGAPLPGRVWLDASFVTTVPEELQPRFRVVPADELVATFSSDRAHMRLRDGRYRQPPPPWPAIVRGPSNLDRFLDVDDAFVGEVLDLSALRARLVL